ncbi:MAG: mechanosensitive ion channel family protein, partial [Acidobacteria bacterium]|nr:mechanosensitive ion channel family protein [Acidobacteriota bacterium]
LVALALLILGLFAWIARWVGRSHLPWGRLSANRFVQDLARQVLRSVVFLVGLLLALEILDATALAGAVLGTAGVVGIAVGFAFRDLVENFISSVLLSLRQPFEPNDLVAIDGLEGKVVRLTSRATVLMTLDGNHLRIPNAKVFKGVILNYSRNPMRRFDVGIGVGVDEDLLEAQRLGVEILTATPGVAADPPPSAVVDALGDSSVTVRYYGWVDQREASFADVRGEAIRRVKTALEDAGIDLPEPIYRLRLEGTGAAAAAPEPAPKSLEETKVFEPRPSGTTAPPAGDAVDRQIADERATGGEDLLDEGAPKE